MARGISMGEKFLSDFCAAVTAGDVSVNPIADYDYLPTAFMRAGWDLEHAGICPTGTYKEFIKGMGGVVEASRKVNDVVALDAAIGYINAHVEKSPQTQRILGLREKLLAGLDRTVA